MGESVRTIYVDLDQTLVRIDLLQERLLIAILRNPAIFFKAIVWLLQGGRVRLKIEIARRATLDVANLPYNQELLTLLKEEREAGLALVLATAAPSSWALAVARYLGFFDRVLATDETHGNLKGKQKLAMILKDVGGKPFGYAGDSSADRPILAASELPIVVGAGAGLAGKQAEKAIVISPGSNWAMDWWKSLRPYLWSKNLLIFAPVIAAHRMDRLWPNGVMAFWAFSLVASALYLLNNFYDLDVDRQHPDKRFRAQASGSLRPPHAIALVVLLLLAAGGAAIHLPFGYTLVLICYGVVNLLYSAVIKNVVVLDLVTLAFLTCLRIFAGGAACGLHVSAWLLTFTFFLALSLAHLKRYTELMQYLKKGTGYATPSTYTFKDSALLMKVGLSSGLVSVLILAVYVTVQQSASIYKTPALLFVDGGLLYYGLERIWSRARHDRITGDSIFFIVTDPVSYLLVIASMAIVWVASIYYE